MNKMKLVLGDWSDDGHGKSDSILVMVNKTVEEVQQAYRDSCKLTGVQFHDENAVNAPICIAVEYEDYSLSDDAFEIFQKHGLTLDMFNKMGDDVQELDELYISVSSFPNLWFWFIKLSLPDLEYTIITEDSPTINGYWGKLNHQFGYGLYT